MNFCNLRFFFLATFYFLICVKADWSEDRGLIVNQLLARGYPYAFPPVVRYYRNTGQYKFIDSGDITTRTYYLCPYHPNFGYINETCVFRHDLPETVNEPRCQGGIVNAQLRSTGKQCGKNDDPGFHYQVSYKICKYKKRTVLESEKWLKVYEICYSTKYSNQMYSHFAIEKTALLGNNLLSNEANASTTLQDNNPVILNTGTFKFQPVLPPQLMAWGVARRTFLYDSNLAYMHSGLIEFWNSLIDQIKNKLINAEVSVEVYAGIYGELTYVNARVIPQIWWITIYDSQLNNGTTVILPNQYYSDTASIPIHCVDDDIITCQNVNLEVPNGMYCCAANSIATLIGIPIQVSGYYIF